jgi:dipeptidyl aminopeptidase/acylaminoacyl peptidase
MTSEKCFFNNSKGYKLAGIILYPADAMYGSRPIVVFSHGFDSGKDSPRGVLVANELLKRGIASFLIDFTGHGESEGAKYESTIEQQVDDLQSAISYMQSAGLLFNGGTGVNGASSGGLVAIKLSLSNSKVRALVLRGPRTDDMSPVADKINAPVMIVQGEFDPLLEETLIFYSALRTDKKMEIIKGADHLFSEEDQLLRVAKLTADWFQAKLK